MAPVSQQKKYVLGFRLADPGRGDFEFHSVAVPMLQKEIAAPAVTAKQSLFGKGDQLRALVCKQMGAGFPRQRLTVCADHPAHGAVG